MKLSLIIPCYNESGRLSKLFDGLSNFVFSAGGSNDSLNIVFIDDGSVDDTNQILSQYCKISQYPSKVISYSVNQGKGYAIKTGILQTDSDFFLVMDADLATDLQHINDFWTSRNRSDIIIGDRNEFAPTRSFFRQIGGYIGRFLINSVLSFDYPDTQCGFKLFSKKTKPLFETMKIMRWGFDFELLYMAKIFDYQVTVQGVHRKDQSGSKVGMMSYFNTLYELIQVRAYWHSNKFNTTHAYLNYLFYSTCLMMKSAVQYVFLFALWFIGLAGITNAQMILEHGGSIDSYNGSSYYGYNDYRSDSNIDYDATGQTGDNVFATGSSSRSYNYSNTGSSNYGWGTNWFSNPGNIQYQTGYSTGFGNGTQDSFAVDTNFYQYGTGSSYFHQYSINEFASEGRYGFGSTWYHFEGFGIRYGFGSTWTNSNSTGYASGTSYWSYGNGSSQGYGDGMYLNNNVSSHVTNNTWWYNNCGYGNGSSWSTNSQYGGASSYNVNGVGSSIVSAPVSDQYGFATSYQFYGNDCGYGMGTNYSTGSNNYTGWSGQTFTGRVQGVCDYFNQQFELTQWSLYESLLDYFNCNVGNQPIVIIQDPYVCGSSLKGKITSSDPYQFVQVTLGLYSGNDLIKSFNPVVQSDGSFDQVLEHNNLLASNYVAPGSYLYKYMGSDYRGVASGSYNVLIRKLEDCSTPSGGGYSGPASDPVLSTGTLTGALHQSADSSDESAVQEVGIVDMFLNLIDTVKPYIVQVKNIHPAAAVLPATGVDCP